MVDLDEELDAALAHPVSHPVLQGDEEVIATDGMDPVVPVDDGFIRLRHATNDHRCEFLRTDERPLNLALASAIADGKALIFVDEPEAGTHFSSPLLLLSLTVMVMLSPHSLQYGQYALFPWRYSMAGPSLSWVLCPSWIGVRLRKPEPTIPGPQRLDAELPMLSSPLRTRHIWANVYLGNFATANSMR